MFSAIGVIGSSALPNQAAYAQDYPYTEMDTDGDYVVDEEDLCPQNPDPECGIFTSEKYDECVDAAKIAEANLQSVKCVAEDSVSTARGENIEVPVVGGLGASREKGGEQTYYHTKRCAYLEEKEYEREFAECERNMLNGWVYMAPELLTDEQISEQIAQREVVEPAPVCYGPLREVDGVFGAVYGPVPC